MQPVSLADGAAIFNGAQGCQNCHGVSGQGNGAVATQIACKLPNVADPGVARAVTVAAWFAITTNGNGGDTSCLMPPWKSILSEQQRWNVTSYLYSLHYTPDMLSAGAKIWTANCAACHGAGGAGDGPKAAGSPRPVPNFTDPSYLIAHSDTDLYASVTHGVGAIMPSFATQLDDASRWNVVAYLRTLSWQTPGAAVTAIATAAPTAAATAAIPDTPTFTVSGTITNGTPGGSIPASLPLTLRVIDLSSGAPKDAGTFTGTATGGAFSFKDVSRQVGKAYVVTAQYAGVQQFSAPVSLPAGIGPTLDIPLTLYEVTSDASDIVIPLQQIIFEFPSASNVLIDEGLSFQNNGKRIYITPQKTSNGDVLSVALPLPAGAQRVILDASIQNQFTVNSPGSPNASGTVQSTTPLFPGESRPLQLSFSLPFDTQLNYLQPTVYPIQALNVYLPEPSGFTLNDPQFAPDQSIQFQDASGQPVTYRTFRFATPPIPPARPISFTAASQASLLNNDAIIRRNALAVVLTLALIVFGLIVLAVWRLGQRDRAVRPANAPDPLDALTGQIADLDDRYAAGEIAQTDYESQRAALKQQLAARLARMM